MQFQIPSFSQPNFDIQSKEQNFQIYLRLKPLFKNQASEVIKQRSATQLEIVSPYYNQTQRSFQFDKILSTSTTNRELFESCLHSPISNVIAGFNSTVLIYGATGAGKTYTMFGDTCSEGVVSLSLKRILSLLKNTKIKYQLTLSFYEIYNETIRDLLQEESSPLNIMEDPHRGIVINELSEHIIQNQQDAAYFLEQGIERRAMNATKSNQVSSRSHAIFQLTLKQFVPTKNDKYKVIQSKLFLVDLAGNQKSSSIGTSNDKRFVQGININKSLLTLGKCISILAEKKNQFVPFRDSKLTRILKQSLGGNSKTVMIACVSLEKQLYEETLNTLKYSSLAKNIKNRRVKNVKEIEKLLISNEFKKGSRRSDATTDIVETIQSLVMSVEEKMKTLSILQSLSIAKLKNQQMVGKTKDTTIYDKINQLTKFSDEIRRHHQQCVSKAEFYENQLFQIINTFKSKQIDNKALQNQHSNTLKQIQSLKYQLKQKERKIQLLEKQNAMHMSSTGSSSAPVQQLSLNKSINRSIKLSSITKRSPVQIDLKSSICLEKQNISGASKVFNKKSRQIVIDLNSKPSKQQFMEDLKNVQKRIRDPASQKEIERLLSLQELYQFELNNMEQSVLRKVKFFQDKKQNGFNSNGESRSSSKGFSLGKLGR